MKFSIVNAVVRLRLEGDAAAAGREVGQDFHDCLQRLRQSCDRLTDDAERLRLLSGRMGGGATEGIKLVNCFLRWEWNDRR